MHDALMSENLHDLIMTHGVEKARELVAVDQRHLVDIAAGMLADEETGRLGFSHAGFALTSLPHRSVTDSVWTREGHMVSLVVSSGHDRKGKIIGLPYGAKARMILLYLQTQAIRNNSREVELGPSMKSWMANMGIARDAVGGMTYKLVTEQARRISSCRLTFFSQRDKLELRQNGAFVDQDVSLFSDFNGRQQLLWQETVTLNELFFRSLKQHPVPLAESALRHIAGSSLAIDIYIWLAYRLHVLKGPVEVSWAALHRQFGTNCRRPSHLKPYFLEGLRLALAVYPGARVDENGRKGIVLHPCRPPVSYIPGIGRI
jgi:hypothetical protein